MKLLTALFLLIALPLFGAVPSYDKFVGTGGITVTPNPPNGNITIDGSGVVASAGTNATLSFSTNGILVAVASTNMNVVIGNNMVIAATNLASKAHFGIGIKSNLSFFAQNAETVFGTWGTVAGWSNVATGDLMIYNGDVAAGDNLTFSAILTAPSAVFNAVPSSGAYLAISPGGVLYRTNAVSSSNFLETLTPLLLTDIIYIPQLVTSNLVVSNSVTFYGLTGFVTNVVNGFTNAAAGLVGLLGPTNFGNVRVKGLAPGANVTLTDTGTNIIIASSGGSGTSSSDTNAVLTNLVGTVARNVTNVVSLSTTNATSKPLTNSYASGTLTLPGIEAGANVTITANGSNWVIAASASGGGGGAGSMDFNANQFVTNSLVNIKDGVLLTNLVVKAAEGASTALTVDTNVLVVAAGKVGVGTSTIVNKLDVEGAVAIGASYSGTSTAPANGLLVQGRVGIETTSPGVVSLQIGDGSMTHSVRIGQAGGTATSGYLQLNSIGANSGYIEIYNPTPLRLGYIGLSLTDLAVTLENSADFVVNGGKTGLGTSTPANILDVEGAVAIGAAYSGTSSAPTDGLIVVGNVGINTAAPTNKLSVNGSVRIETNLFLPNLRTNGSPVALLGTDADGAVFETALATAGGFSVSGNSNQIGYLTVGGNAFMFGSRNKTNPGVGFVRSANRNTGALLIHVDENEDQGLVQIGPPVGGSSITDFVPSLSISNRYDQSENATNQEMVRVNLVDVNAGSGPESYLQTWRNWTSPSTLNSFSGIKKDGSLFATGIRLMTNGATLTNMLYATTNINFPSVAAGGVFDAAVSVPGAADGDIVAVGVQSAAIASVTGDYTGWASNGVVYIRFQNNNLVTAQDPASGVFAVRVDRFK